MALHRVVWVIDLDEEGSPVEIARKALAIQRKPDSIATVFTVQPWISGSGPAPESEAVKVDLGEDGNPFGWPPARIEGNQVLCGHCGGKVQLVADLGEYHPVRADDGFVIADTSARHHDEDGDNKRLWCLDCNETSLLPRDEDGNDKLDWE